jgi:predicted alpha/beta hydrolase family esterase
VILPALRAVSAAAVELSWVTAHTATYPLGLLRDRGDDLDPGLLTLERLPLCQRGLIGADVAAATTPIVLIHGIVDNRSIFALLRRGLRRRGFGCIRSFSYGPHTMDVRETAERFGAFVEAVIEETGSDQVYVVGHSLGGLIARYYAQCLDESDRIHTLVTLGSPHHGTRAARFSPHKLIRQLRPDSDLITELDEPSSCATRFLCFYSDVDHLIVPADNARLRHPDLTAVNVPVQGVGHLSMPISRGIVHQIGTTFASRRPVSRTAVAGAPHPNAQATG